jgi:predicted DNA-binding transcriptional regulator YafY
MRLTSAELAALELGLAMLRAEHPEDDHRAIEGARDRLGAARAVVAGEERREGARHASLGEMGDPARFAALRRAVRARRKVRLAYRRADAAEAGERTACPYMLVVARGAWYLVAHCERSEALRIFRLDRVERAEVTDERFERPDTLAVEDFVRDGRILSAEGARTLRVRYSPRVARWIAERERLPLDADGSLTMEHPLADTAWAVRHVLQYGPDAEVLEPDDVRAELRRRLAAMLEVTAPASS